MAPRRHEVPGGIQVGRAGAEPEVQDRACCSQPLAEPHGLTCPHDDRAEPGVAGAQEIRMGDHHDEPPCDLTGERHRPIADRCDATDSRRVVLDAPVARSVPGRRRGTDRSPAPPRAGGMGVARDLLSQPSRMRTARPAPPARPPPRRSATVVCRAASRGGTQRDGTRRGGTRPRRNLGQTMSRSKPLNRDRSCSTALVWIWHTRDSVTPSTRPISDNVRFS